MKIFINDNTDPYFNLASEQYLLDKVDGEIFMLWRNDNAVIIGKNQNAYSEINIPFVKEKNIKVVRRLTGGGAVFHDLGNLNYTYIVPKKNSDTLDFKRFSTPVIDALSSLGIAAELSGRNDLTVDGKKISGNAQCVYNDKIMHHGTILFSADISNLSGALNVDPDKIKSKGIKSVRSRVTNLSSYLPQLDIIAFKNYLLQRLDGELISFTDEQIDEIYDLAKNKYSTWEWNFGKSKEYSKVSKQRYTFGSVEIHMNAEGGMIKDIKFLGDYFEQKDISKLESSLVGVRLDQDDLQVALSDVSDYIMGAESSLIIEQILR